MKRPALFAIGIVAASSVLVAPACVPSAPGGPWACQPGYATCRGDGAGYGNDPGCETNVTSDAQNCGSCGKTCPQGALCLNSACTAPPTVITTDAVPSQLGIDSQNLYYRSMQSGTLEGIPKTGGKAFPISLPGNIGGSSGQVPFAVDDTGVYYPASSPNGSGPNVTTIDRVSPDGSSTQGATIATFPGQGAFGNVSAMTLFQSTIIVFSMNGPGFETWSVAQTGGTPTQGAQVPSNQNGTSFPGLDAVAVDATNVYFVDNTATSNGNCQIGVVPLAGGTASSLAANAASAGGCPSTLATDGTNLYWSISASFSENCGNNGCESQCVLDVYSEPIAGGTPTVLAQLSDDSSSIVMAVDGSNLYVLTGQSIWRIPTAGGTPAPTQLAANLNVGVGSVCNGGNGGGGGNSSQTASIAIDATNLYLALPSGLISLPK